MDELPAREGGLGTWCCRRLHDVRAEWKALLAIANCAWNGGDTE